MRWYSLKSPPAAPTDRLHWDLEKPRFPQLRRLAKRILKLFGSTCICEQMYSLTTQKKSRMRSKTTDLSPTWCTSKTHAWPDSNSSVQGPASVLIRADTYWVKCNSDKIIWLQIQVYSTKGLNSLIKKSLISKVSWLLSSCHPWNECLYTPVLSSLHHVL